MTTPGAVIDGLDVTGTIRVQADNVTIRNTRFNSAPCGQAWCQWYVNVECDCAVTISHVEFTATSPAVQFGVRNDTDGHLSLDHVYHDGNVGTLCYCGSSSRGWASVSDSYSDVYQAIPDDHVENIYADDVTFTADHNTFINAEPQTANVFVNVANGSDGATCVNDVTLTRNLFAGGGYTTYVCPHAGSYSSLARAVVTGNMFTRCGHGAEYMVNGGLWLCPNGADDYGLFPRGGSFGRSASMPPNTTWTGNVWDDDGSAAPR